MKKTSINNALPVITIKKSGNVTEYRINLIKKIGVEEVERLERKDHPPLKLTNDEIKAKIALYKNKIKELEGRE